MHDGINSAKTIFVNAVMGLMPSFWHGTSKMDETIDRNRTAQKFFGGGDTLQEFKRSFLLLSILVSLILCLQVLPHFLAIYVVDSSVRCYSIGLASKSL